MSNHGGGKLLLLAANSAQILQAILRWATLVPGSTFCNRKCATLQSALLFLDLFVGIVGT